MIIDYKLPNKDNISNLHSIEYSVRKDKFDKIYLRDKTFEEMYDNMLYQITLRTIYEIFQSDKNNFINIVVFNGCLDYIEKSTGEEKTYPKVLLATSIFFLFPLALFGFVKGGQAKIAPNKVIDVSLRNDFKFVSEKL